MLNNQTLAIQSIRTHGMDNGWGDDVQLIETCNFISDNNLDEEFEKHLKERGEQKRRM